MARFGIRMPNVFEKDKQKEQREYQERVARENAIRSLMINKGMSKQEAENFYDNNIMPPQQASTAEALTAQGLTDIKTGKKKAPPGMKRTMNPLDVGGPTQAFSSMMPTEEKGLRPEVGENTLPISASLQDILSAAPEPTTKKKEPAKDEKGEPVDDWYKGIFRKDQLSQMKKGPALDTAEVNKLNQMFTPEGWQKETGKKVQETQDWLYSQFPNLSKAAPNYLKNVSAGLVGGEIDQTEAMEFLDQFDKEARARKTKRELDQYVMASPLSDEAKAIVMGGGGKSFTDMLAEEGLDYTDRNSPDWKSANDAIKMQMMQDPKIVAGMKTKTFIEQTLIAFSLPLTTKARYIPQEGTEGQYDEAGEPLRRKVNNFEYEDPETGELVQKISPVTMAQVNAHINDLIGLMAATKADNMLNVSPASRLVAIDAELEKIKKEIEDELEENKKLRNQALGKKSIRKK